jgi:hypothetical protein
MRWTRRRVQTLTTWVPVVAWAVLYAVALANADPLPPLETAVRALVVPPLLWVVAARLVLRHWWSGPGSRMSGMDLPGWLLAVAVAALPERRRAWGRAMLAELAEVEGRSARWRFALSSVRAMLWLPPAAAVYLAAVLAGCLWIALAAPRWLGTSRLAPHLGVAAAVVFAAWFCWRTAPTGPSPRSRSCSCSHLCSCPHRSPSSSSRRSRRVGPAGRSARACRPPSGPWPP